MAKDLILSARTVAAPAIQPSRPKALRLYAGAAALKHIERYGVRPQDVRVIPAAAGGPKGLILNPLDRFLFGSWLKGVSGGESMGDGVGARQSIDLLGASIGAWRMAAACMDDPDRALADFAALYIAQALPPACEGDYKRSNPRAMAAHIESMIQSLYGGQLAQICGRQGKLTRAQSGAPNYHLHIFTARGKRLLNRERPLLSHTGFLAAFATNAVSRPAMGRWFERVVFSSQITPHDLSPMPFSTQDYPTRQAPLVSGNFEQVLLASGAIPTAIAAVHDIAHAPKGAYWDGGVTDYHLHLQYRIPADGLVLYPHFQQQVIPGWFDKGLRRRHAASSALDTMLLLAPNPDWVKTLPNAKLPDRQDFVHYRGQDAARVKAWQQAVSAAQQLADEWADWLSSPDLSELQPI